MTVYQDTDQLQNATRRFEQFAELNDEIINFLLERNVRALTVTVKTRKPDDTPTFLISLSLFYPNKENPANVVGTCGAPTITLKESVCEHLATVKDILVQRSEHAMRHNYKYTFTFLLDENGLQFMTICDAYGRGVSLPAFIKGYLPHNE